MRVAECVRKHTEAGSVSAQHELAMRYLTGTRVEKNQVAARKWGSAAAWEDYVWAKKKRAELEAQGELTAGEGSAESAATAPGAALPKASDKTLPPDPAGGRLGLRSRRRPRRPLAVFNVPRRIKPRELVWKVVGRRASFSHVIGGQLYPLTAGSAWGVAVVSRAGQRGFAAYPRD